MRKIVFVIMLVSLLPMAANAAAIAVFAPGLLGSGIRALGASWSTETGNTVTFVGGAAGKVETAINSGTPGDVAIVPDVDMPIVSAKLKPGSNVAIGRIPFGLGVAVGAPAPDISTEAKFQATLNSARTVVYNDPKMSLAGVVVQKMLSRPGYAGVKTLLTEGGSANAVVKGAADVTVGVITEELTTKGLGPVVLLPQSLDLHIDFSAAQLANSAEPEAAASFIAYITRPEAAAIWKAGGVIAPVP